MTAYDEALRLIRSGYENISLGRLDQAEEDFDRLEGIKQCLSPEDARRIEAEGHMLAERAAS